MSAQLTDEEALNRVASYCSTAEHCRAEINEKLQRWGIAYDTIARILTDWNQRSLSMMNVSAELL
mgnify:CR=1 FL=1